VNTNPAHASLFTGLYPVRHGNRLNANRLPSEIETLSTAFTAAGYRTGAFVSGYTMKAAQTAFDRGFAVYDDRFAGYSRRGEKTVDAALAWLADVPGDEPFFLFVHLFDPHGTYAPPPELAQRFRVGDHPPLGEEDVIPRYQRLAVGDAEAYSRDPLDYLSRYDGEIAYADAQIARLLAAVGDQAFVVFTADHGETLLDRYHFFDHGCRLNEEQIRVPLILRLPDASLAGKRVRGLVSLVDVMPTVLSYHGLPVSEDLPGRDLLPHVVSGAVAGKTHVFGEARSSVERVRDRGYALDHKRLVLSVRDERYKLIRYPTAGDPIFELFDLDRDPGERRNLAAKKPRKVERLAARLDEYAGERDAPDPPELDEEAREKLRSLGYID